MLRIATLSAVAIAFAAGSSTGALAQSVSQEQAWHQCIQYVDKMVPRTGENDQERTAQFKACMSRLQVRP